MESRGGGALALALGLTLPPGGSEGFACSSVRGTDWGACCEKGEGLVVRMIDGFLSIGLLNVCGAGLECVGSEVGMGAES